MHNEKIKQVIDCRSSADEAREVVSWLSSSYEGQQCLSDMIDADFDLSEDELISEYPVSPITSERMWNDICQTTHRRTIRRSAMLVAASILPFIILIGGGFYLANHIGLPGKATVAEVYAPRGETLRIVFQDGSEAFLNSDSRLTYPSKFSIRNRKVQLSGEAYFQVASNKHRPFIVETGNSSLSVRGTSFNVNAYDGNENIEVVLDEGRVTFNSPQNSHTMQPGQHLQYNRTTEQLSISTLVKPGTASLWKSNIIHFDDTPFAEAAKIMERRYDLTFHVADSTAFRYTYTLTTHQTTPEKILKELEKISPLRFEQKEDLIVVRVNK